MSKVDGSGNEFTPEFYYSLLPKEVREGFSNEQAYAVKVLLKRVVRVPSVKILDLETCIWFMKPLYLSLYLGNNNRKRKRKFKRKRDFFFSIFLKFTFYVGFLTLCLASLAGIVFLFTKI